MLRRRGGLLNTFLIVLPRTRHSTRFSTKDAIFEVRLPMHGEDHNFPKKKIKTEPNFF